MGGCILGLSRPDPTKEAGLVSPQREQWPPAVIKGQQAPPEADDWKAGRGSPWGCKRSATATDKWGHPSALSTMGSLTPDPGPFLATSFGGLPLPHKDKGGEDFCEASLFSEEPRSPVTALWALLRLKVLVLELPSSVAASGVWACLPPSASHRGTPQVRLVCMREGTETQTETL